MRSHVCSSRPPGRAAAAVAALLGALALGCGSSGDYQLAPVSGVVKLDGKPVPYTQVIFLPKGAASATPGPGSSAFCDDAGRFVLQTVRGEPGAVVGLHSVQISAHGPPQSTAGDRDVGPPAKEAFPARYNTDSQLTFEVRPDGTTRADFNLQSAPP